MVVVVSLEDAEFLRKHKWEAAALEKAHGETITLNHPDTMPIDVLEEAYALTTGTTDLEIGDWRFKAFFSIKERTGKDPGRPFGPAG